MDNPDSAFDIDVWFEWRDKVKEAVWVEGVLLPHPQKARVYLTLEDDPSHAKVIYELSFKDIAIPEGQPVEYNKRTRVYISRIASILKHEWTVGAALPFEAASTKEQPAEGGDAPIDIKTSNAGRPYDPGDPRNPRPAD